MIGVTFQIPNPGERMSFTGERYTTGLSGNIQNEHYHRYLFALRLCENQDVLDVASGEGYGTALLAQVARSVVGVDIDESSVAFASRSYVQDNLRFHDGSALALPLDDDSVDVVVSFETIEHLQDHAAFLEEVRRVLRPNGVFIVSTPDRRIYSEEPGYKNPFHLKELSRDEFVALLRRGFPKVDLYEQQIISGSVIAQVGEAVSGTESFSTDDGGAFARTAGLPKAPYLIAIAHTEAEKLPTASMLHGLPTDYTQAAQATSAFLPEGVVRQVAALQESNDDLRHQLYTANLNAAKLQRELFEADHQRGYLRAMLTNARRVADTARAEHVHARAEMAAWAETWKETISREQLRVQAEHAHARAEDAHARAKMAAEMTAWTETIRRSTSWRLTGPMRIIVRFARRAFR